MIDIGVNLTNARFNDDREQVIAKAKAAGVSSIIVTGTNIDESSKAVKLAEKHLGFLYTTAGVHPHDADHVPEDYLAKLKQLLLNANVVAVGECGLDFNRNFSRPDKQLEVFKAQVKLAEQVQLPLFLHQRDAFEPWLNILKPYQDKIPAMVSHCFTGTKSELLQCLNAGMYIGITGWLCDKRRGESLREAVQYLPLSKLMIETDAPFLTPQNIQPKPKRSRNEPCYLPFIVKKLAEIYGCDQQTIIQHSVENTKKVFDLPIITDC